MGDYLCQSMHLSVLALFSYNRGDSVTFGMVVLICLLGEGENIWGLTHPKTSRYQKCYMCSEIWGRPD